jgi:hypothetical protein
MNRRELESLERESLVIARRTLDACRADAMELERIMAHARAAAVCTAAFMDTLTVCPPDAASRESRGVGRP